MPGLTSYCIKCDGLDSLFAKPAPLEPARPQRHRTSTTIASKHAQWDEKQAYDQAKEWDVQFVLGDSSDDDDSEGVDEATDDTDTSAQLHDDEHAVPRVHYLRPDDTLSSLSLLYRVPELELLTLNSLPLHASRERSLLHTRASVVLPARVERSLSAQPTTYAGDEASKRANRRERHFQARTRCFDAPTCTIYLEASRDAWLAQHHSSSPLLPPSPPSTTTTTKNMASTSAYERRTNERATRAHGAWDHLGATDDDTVVDRAVEAFLADSAWEREQERRHRLGSAHASGSRHKGKERQSFLGRKLGKLGW